MFDICHHRGFVFIHVTKGRGSRGKFSIEFRICLVQNFFLDFCQNFWSRAMHDKKLDVNLASFEL